MVTTFAPLKTLTSASHTVALYPDRLVIERTDWLSRLVGSHQVVYLNDIHEIRLYTSRFMTNSWLQFAIIAAHHGLVALNYHINQQREVREFKEAIEEVLSRKELLPLPVV